MYRSRLQLARIGADTDDELTRFPVMLQFRIVKFQVVGCDLEDHRPALSGLQADLLESAQILDAAGHAGHRVTDVQLYDLLAGIIAGVRHRDGCGQCFIATRFVRSSWMSP